ncbi:hypothetical protein [Burkholderia sp. BCC1985]|uniref:hypothetical protein n=1 Tax=Burkholderia sp. BCC1985 TaxID=2817442 RepID=UPI002AAF70FB|nr:hypothetical protein [Burkholderia sp. BCC1985]
MITDKKDPRAATIEDTQRKLTQLCSLLAITRMPAFVMEATEETQMDVLALAHELALDISRQLNDPLPSLLQR